MHFFGSFLRPRFRFRSCRFRSPRSGLTRACRFFTATNGVGLTPRLIGHTRVLVGASSKARARIAAQIPRGLSAARGRVRIRAWGTRRELAEPRYLARRQVAGVSQAGCARADAQGCTCARLRRVGTGPACSAGAVLHATYGVSVPSTAPGRDLRARRIVRETARRIRGARPVIPTARDTLRLCLACGIDGWGATSCSPVTASMFLR